MSFFRRLGQPMYLNRRNAGAELARKLECYMGRDDVVVLGLPRGGVPVAFEVAQALGAELDIFLVRKLGVPGHRELAMGAIASGGVRVLNQDVISLLGIPKHVIDEVARDEQGELERRERLYRGDRPPVDIRDRIVVLVDDGLATGSTMRAAVEAVRKYEPARIVVAVPVAPPSTCAEFESIADDIVCAQTPEPFSAVGQWYREFSQTVDEEVRDLLREHRDRPRAVRGTV
jgi:putative phosphoribosyl transferase